MSNFGRIIECTCSTWDGRVHGENCAVTKYYEVKCKRCGNRLEGTGKREGFLRLACKSCEPDKFIYDYPVSISVA